jgi:hypothetical protein
VSLVQRIAFVDVAGPGQTIEHLPHLGVRDRDLRLVVHEMPIALGERAVGRLRDRGNEPFDLGADRRRVVGGGPRVRFEEDVEIDDQLGERTKPREASIADEQLKPLARRSDGAALLLEFAARPLGERPVQRAQRGGERDEFGLRLYGITCPPFTSRICPVTNPDSASDAR